MQPATQKTFQFKLSIAIVCLSVLLACSNDSIPSGGLSDVKKFDNNGVPIIGPQNIEDGKVIMDDISMTFSEFLEEYCFGLKNTRCIETVEDKDGFRQRDCYDKGQNATCLEVVRQAQSEYIGKWEEVTSSRYQLEIERSGESLIVRSYPASGDGVIMAYKDGLFQSIGNHIAIDKTSGNVTYRGVDFKRVSEFTELGNKPSKINW